MKRTDQLTKNFNQASSASQRRAFPSTWPDLGNPCPQDLHNSKVTKDLARSFNSASIECTKQECRKFERAGHSILDGWMSFNSIAWMQEAMTNRALYLLITMRFYDFFTRNNEFIVAASFSSPFPFSVSSFRWIWWYPPRIMHGRMSHY